MNFFNAYNKALKEYNAIMTHGIILRKKIRNVSGDYITDSEVLLHGFIQFDTDFKFDKNSEMFGARAIVFLRNDCGIDENYKYYEIDQTTPNVVTKLVVLSIERIDFVKVNKTHHYELIVK